jgi:hypothetical protein
MGMLQNQNPPAFPVPPKEYDQAYMNMLINILRMFLNQVNAQQIISVNGIIFDYNTLPDQTQVSSLRPGQVYVDKTASYVLKVKP